MSDRNESPWRKSEAANDNTLASANRNDSGNRTQLHTMICDLPHNPGIIKGEAELLARFFDVIERQLEAANDNEDSGKD